MKPDMSKFVASHVSGLPKSGIRDFFAIVAGMSVVVGVVVVVVSAPDGEERHAHRQERERGDAVDGSHWFSP